MDHIQTGIEQWLLSMHPAHKLNLMRSALLNKEHAHFSQLLDIFTNASLLKGGIGTDRLKQAFGPDLCNPDYETGGKQFDFKTTTL